MAEEEDTGSPRLSDLEHEVDSLKDHVNNLTTKVEKKRNNLQEFISLTKSEDKSYEEIYPKLQDVQNNLLDSGKAKNEFETFKTRLEERRKEVSEKLARLEILLKEILEEEPKIKDLAIKVNELNQDEDDEEVRDEELDKLKKENDEWWAEIREKFKECKKLRISLLKGKDEDLAQEFMSWEKASFIIKETGGKLAQFKKELKAQKEENENLKDEVLSLEKRASEAEGYKDEIQKLLAKIESDEKEKLKLEKNIDIGKHLLEENEKLVDTLELRNKELTNDIAEERKRALDLRSEMNDLQTELDEEKESIRDTNAEIEKLQEMLDKEREENERWTREVEVLQGKRTEEEAVKEEIASLREDLENKEDKIEDLRNELEEINDKHRDGTRKLEEKERELRDKTEDLRHSEENLQSEKLIKEEYVIKCEMLEQKVFLAESDNKELQSATDDLKKELKQEEETLEKLKDQLQMLKMNNEELQNNIKELSEEKITEHKRLLEVRSEMNDLQSELDEEKENKLAAQSQVKKLQDKLDKEKEESKRLLEEKRIEDEAVREKIAALREDLQRKEDKLNNLENDLEKIHDSHRDITRELKDKENELRDKSENLRHSEDNLHSEKNLKDEYAIKCQTLEHKLFLAVSESKEMESAAEIQEKKLKQEEERVEKLQHQLKMLKENVEELQNNVTELSEEKITEHKRLLEVRSEINELQYELDEEKENNRVACSQVEKLQNNLDKEKEECKRLLEEKQMEDEQFKDKIEALREELQSKEDKVVNLRNDLEKINENNRDITRELEEREKKLRDITDDLRNTEDNLESEKNMKDEYAIKCETLEHKLFLAESENKEMESAAEIQGEKIKQEEDRIEKLQDQLRMLKGNIEELHNNIAELTEEKITEHKSLLEATSDIKELQNELDEEKENSRTANVEVKKLQEKLDNEKEETERWLQEKRNQDEEVKEKIAGLKEELESKEDKIVNLRTDLEKINDNQRDITRELAEREKTLRSITENLRHSEDNLQSERYMKDEYAIRCEALEHKLFLSESESKEIQNAAEIQENLLKQEEERVQKLQNQLKLLKGNNEDLQNKITELAEEKMTEHKRFLKAKSEINELQNEVDEEKENSRTANEQIQKLQEKLDKEKDENKEIQTASEIQEKILKEEKKRVEELQDQLKSIKRNNEELQCEITELNEQLSAAEAYDQYNQAIKSQSLESLRSAEEENEQLIGIIEDLKEDVSEKELGIHDIVERYAIEEQRLKNDISNLTRELQIFKNDCITKSQIIDDLREELDNRSPTQESNSTTVELEALRDRNKEIGARVATLETELIKERERNEKFEETILELNMRYDEAEDKYETFDKEASEELDRKDEQIDELTRKIEEEQERLEQLELQLESLKEIGKLGKELSDSKNVDAGETELLKNRMEAMKEEFERNEIRRRDDRIEELMEEIERMNDQLRDEQCEAAEKDGIISDFKETSLKDRQKITEYAEETQDLKEHLRIKKQHVEELTEKVLESQILVMDLQSEAESERSRAATIEDLLTAEKGRYFHQITIVHDLKKKVEEYQSTVGEIKSKVDRINRHLRCLPQGALEGGKSVSTEDLSARKVSQKLTSQRLSLKDIKATVATVEDKHGQLLQEVQEETTKNADQDERIEELFHKTSEYDAIMSEMKKELDNIKGRYEDLNGRFQFQDEEDSAELDKEKEKTETSVDMLKSQLIQFENSFENMFVNEARRIDEAREKLTRVMAKNIEFVKTVSELKVKRYEEIIAGMANELEEERKLNADLTERVIKELEDNFKANQERLNEISKKAEEDEKKSLAMTDKFSAEKSEKEGKIQELLDIMNYDKDVLRELKLNLEKEQETVFELTEELTKERIIVSSKNALIDELNEKLVMEKEETNSLKSALHGESERCLQLNNVITAEQAKGMERADSVKAAEENIHQLQAVIEEKEEKFREMEEELEETKSRADQLTALVEDEVTLCNQIKESLVAEQLVKAGYERDIEELMSNYSEAQHLNEELRIELEHQKELLHDVEHKMKELEQEHLQREALVEALKTALEAEGQNYNVLASRFQAEECFRAELESKLRETEKKMHYEVTVISERKEKEKKEKDEELNSLLARLDDEQARLGELLEGERQRSCELDATLQQERYQLLDKDKALGELHEQLFISNETNEKLAEEKLRNEELEELVKQLQKKVSDNKALVETLIEQNERDSEERKERDARTEELELVLEEWKKKFMEQDQEIELLRSVYQENEDFKNELKILEQDREREREKLQQGISSAERTLQEFETRCNEQEREMEYGKSRYEHLRADMNRKEQIIEENNNELVQLRSHLSNKEKDILLAQDDALSLKQNLESMKTETEEKAKAVKQKEKILRKAGKKIYANKQIVGAVKSEYEQKLAEKDSKILKLEKSIQIIKRMHLATKAELKRLEAVENARMKMKHEVDDKHEDSEAVVKDVQQKLRVLSKEIQCKNDAVQRLEEDLNDIRRIKNFDRKEIKRKENLLQALHSQLSERVKQKSRQEKLLTSLESLYGEEEAHDNEQRSSREEVDGQSITCSGANMSSTASKAERNQDIPLDDNRNVASSQTAFDADVFDDLIKEEESLLSELRGSMSGFSNDAVSEDIAIVETVSVECALPTEYGIFQTVDGSSDESDMGDDDVFEDNPVSEKTGRDDTKDTREQETTGSQGDGRQPRDENIPDLKAVSPGNKYKVVLLCIVLALLLIILPNCISPKFVGIVLAAVVTPAIIIVAKNAAKQQRKAIEKFLTNYKARSSENDDSVCAVANLKEVITEKNRENARQQETIEEMKIQIETDMNLIEQIKEQLEEEIAEKQHKLNAPGGVRSDENSEDLQNIVEMLEKRMRDVEKSRLEEEDKNQVSLEEYKELRNNIDQMRRDREAAVTGQQGKLQEMGKVSVVMQEQEIPKEFKLNVPLFAVPIVVGLAIFLFHFTSQVNALTVQATFCVAVLIGVNSWMSMRRFKKTLLEERKELREQNEEIHDMLEIIDREYDVVKTQKLAIDSLVKELEEEQVNRKAKQKQLAKLVWQLQELEGMKKCIPKQTYTANQDPDLHMKLNKVAEEKAAEKAQFYSNMISKLQEIGAEDDEDEILADDLCGAAKELAVHAEDTMKEVQKMKETLTEEENKKAKRKFTLKAVALATMNTAALVASLIYNSNFIFGAVVATEVVIFGMLKWKSFQSRESEEIITLKRNLEQHVKRNKLQKAENDKLKKLLSTERSYKRSDEFVHEVKERRLKKRGTTS